MATYYVNSNNCAPWLAATAYNVGDRCVSTIGNTSATRQFNVYECTTGGTSHATTEPTWNINLNGTTNDNDVVWTTRRPDSWDNAHHSAVMMTGINAILAAGDIVFVHKTHAENIGSDYNASFPYYGTYNNPVIWCCVDKDNSNAIDIGATITLGKIKTHRGCNTLINIGIITAFNYGPATVADSNLSLIGTSAGQTLLSLNGASNVFTIQSQAYKSNILIVNGNISLANAANIINVSNFFWRKGVLIAPNGSTALLDLSSINRQSEFVIEDVDLSAVGAGALVKIANGLWSGTGLFSRCKLNALTSVLSTAFDNDGYQGKIKLHHCSSANRTWEFGEYAAEGVVIPDAAVYRTGGASDGATPLSWKLVSTAALSKWQIPMSTPTINLWNALTSEITLTVHGILDSATNLKKDEVWLEVEYPADAASGLGAMATSQVIYQPVTGAPADLAASTQLWTEAMGDPNKFQMAVTFTPGKAGPIAARVCVGKPSTTLYICPKAVIS